MHENDIRSPNAAFKKQKQNEIEIGNSMVNSNRKRPAEMGTAGIEASAE